MSGYGVIADNIIYKDKAMSGRADTRLALLFFFWQSQLMFMDLFLRVPIRTKNSQAI